MMLDVDTGVDTKIVVHVIYSYRRKSVAPCMVRAYSFDDKIDALHYLINAAQAYLEQ
jgi:hypothetical protein